MQKWNFWNQVAKFDIELLNERITTIFSYYSCSRIFLDKNIIVQNPDSFFYADIFPDLKIEIVHPEVHNFAAQMPLHKTTQGQGSPQR